VTEALETFRRQPLPPTGLIETSLFAEALAEKGDLEATPYIEALGAAVAPEADAAAARLAYRRGRLDLALASLQSAFTRYRADPWPHQSPMSRALALAREMAAAHPATAPVLLDALARPFAVRALDQERQVSRVSIARAAGLWDRCRDALAPLEPFVPWSPDILRYRAECYEHTGDGRARRAAAERDEFLAAQPPPAAAPASASASPPHR
jgi:spermidine synthase